MPRYLALLRAVNVSGRNMLPMAALRTSMEARGYENVRTYIQSGNVIFEHPSQDEQELRQQLAALIHDEFGVTSPVVIRSREELAAAIAACPYQVDPAEEKLLHIMFLGDEPDAADVAALDPNRSPLDQWMVSGRDIYIRYSGKGVHTSKLSNTWFDSKLKTVSTGRNWRTCNTLLTMLDD